MTIPKGIGGGFEFTVLQRNLKKWHKRPWTSLCLRVLKESNKSRFNSVSRQDQCINHVPLPFGIVACTFFLTTFLEIAVCNRLQVSSLKYLFSRLELLA